MIARECNDRVPPLLPGVGHRLVACIAAGLAFHGALAPVALASMMRTFGANRSAAVKGAGPSVGTTPDHAAAATPGMNGPARADDVVPELWTPRTATLVDSG